MTRSTKAPVPGLMLIIFGIPFILAILAFLYLRQTGNDWMPHLRIPHFPTPARQSEPRLRVWVNKSTGVYYCPDSVMYGRTEHGAYMAQGEAVQTGYTPALGEPCQ